MATNNRFKKSVQTASDNTQQSTTDNVSDNAVNSVLEDILRGDRRERGKNHTIYLSAEVGAALEKHVKNSNISKSELIDKILQKVLLG